MRNALRLTLFDAFSPIALRHYQQHGGAVQPKAQQHMNGNQQLLRNKFPVIDEDLLLLATRRQPQNGSSAPVPPPNLCRLITNVSEARWTSKYLLGSSAAAHPPQRERPKSVGQLPKVSPLFDFPETEQLRRVKMRKKVLDQSQNGQSARRTEEALNKAIHGAHLLKPGTGDVALRRLSALSMVSSVTSNYSAAAAADDAANCDCTSLAMAAFRSNGSKRKKWEAEKGRRQRQRQLDEADDCYRKVSPSSTLTPESPANDSGVSTASSSSDSSRSASLSDAFHCRLNNCAAAGHTFSSSTAANCSRCGGKMDLPPPKASNKDGGGMRAEATEALIVRSRRRRVLNYLLGNMMRILERERSVPAVEGVQGRASTFPARKEAGGIVDLKLMSASNGISRTTPPLVITGGAVPVISVEMVGEEERKRDETSSKVRKGGNV